jgi:hypothetical protein
MTLMTLCQMAMIPARMGRPMAGATRRYSQSVFNTVERSSGG